MKFALCVEIFVQCVYVCLCVCNRGDSSIKSSRARRQKKIEASVLHGRELFLVKRGDVV